MDHARGAYGTLISLAGLFTVALIGLPVFAVQFHRRSYQASERIRRMGGSRLMGVYMMEYGYWMAAFPLRAAARLGVTPDVITLIGLAFVLVASACLAAGWFAIGGWLFLVGCLFDAVDGMLARKLDACSDAGEYLDAIVDRYTEIALFGGLGFYYRDRPLVLAVVLLALLGSVMVSYNRAKAESLGVHDARGWLMRRHERVAYVGFGVAIAPAVAVLLEPGAARPVYHLAVAGCAAVAILANIAAIILMMDVRARLRASARRGAP